MRTNELMLYKNMEYGEILKDITFLIDHYESEYYNREDLNEHCYLIVSMNCWNCQ